MKRRYGKSVTNTYRRRKRRFRRKRFSKKRKVLPKKYAKKIAKSITPFLGETKDFATAVEFDTQVVSSTTGAAVIFGASFFGTGYIVKGTNNNQRVGDDIYVIAIQLRVSITVTSTTYNLHPYRILIYKTFVSATNSSPNEIYLIGDNNLYLTGPFEQGFGTMVKSVIVPPILPTENEFNGTSQINRTISINIPVHKVFRIDARDSSLMNHAHYLIHVMRSGLLPTGVTDGPDVRVYSRILYKDH
jgi:hypothetical protein